MSDTDFTEDELLFAADILRSMLDESQADNRQLRQRIEELESILRDYDIPIPDHDIWHDDLPVT